MDLRGLLGLVSPSLLLEMRLGNIISRINPLFSPSTFPEEEKHTDFARSMMADSFESQLDELETERTLSSMCLTLSLNLQVACPDANCKRPYYVLEFEFTDNGLADLEKLYLNITRLQLRILCLRHRETPQDSLNLTNLGIAATFVVGLVEQLDTEASLVLHCPHYIFRMTALAAAVLLVLMRLFKRMAPTNSTSDYRSGGEDGHINENQGYKHFLFKAISLMRGMSVESNDMPSRMAKIFSQLWASDTAFQRVPLRASDDAVDASSAVYPFAIQSRLSMSVLHDCMWRWREEFGSSDPERNKANTTIASTAEISSNNPAQHSMAAPMTPGSPLTGNLPAPGNLDASLPQTALGFDGPTMSMTDAFSSFSPLWNGSPDQDFEMMIHQFPNAWPL